MHQGAEAPSPTDVYIYGHCECPGHDLLVAYEESPLDFS